jgi:putative transposase
MKYDTDLTDDQWAYIEPQLPPKKNLGRPSKYNPRDLINAIFYILSNGNKWRSMPSDFPHYMSVFKFFRKLKDMKKWEEINNKLSELVREKYEKDHKPTLVCIDSQSVKSDCVTNKEDTGYDGNKKIKGVKRHLIIDVLGLILGCFVTAANVADVTAAREMLPNTMSKSTFSNVEILLGDKGYQGLQNVLNKINVELSTKDSSIKGFVPEPKRWAVERSFAWLGKNRRLNKQYEKSNTTHEQFIYISNIKTCLNKLS